MKSVSVVYGVYFVRCIYFVFYVNKKKLHDIKLNTFFSNRICKQKLLDQDMLKGNLVVSWQLYTPYLIKKNYIDENNFIC